jgi:ElaB/YqjD/DUF883 family membrane-anchored ribosome-binding protein
MKESAHLQREAEVQRAGLADTLGQLREGVTGQAISAEITGVVRDVSLSLVKGLADSARNNPGAALLIGAGLTMMLTKTKGGDVMAVANSAMRAAASAGGSMAATAAGSVRSAATTAASTVTDKVKSVAGHASAEEPAAGTSGNIKGTTSGIANTVSGATDTVAAKISEVTDNTVDRFRRTAHDTRDEAAHLVKEGQRRAEELTDEASRLATDTRQAMARLFEEQPILVAAVGTAIGALLGAALPVSQAEREVLGKTGAQALDAGREAIHKAKEVVGEELKDAQLGQKAGQATSRAVDAIVSVPNPE